MTVLGSADVSVLDLRIDSRTLPDHAEELGLAGRVIVIDNTGSLVDNHEKYQALSALPHLRGMLCVAVGRIDGRNELRLPTALGQVGGTLWVADAQGILWSEDEPARRLESEAPSRLKDLVGALSDHRVFDEVLRLLRNVPHQAVCPGIRMVNPTVGEAELDSAWRRALREITASGAGHRIDLPVNGPDPAATGPQLPAGSPLLKARDDVRQRVSRMRVTASRLRGLAGLFGRRPWGLLAWQHARIVGDSLAKHRELVGFALGELDKQAVGNSAHVDRLGMPAPDAPDHDGLAGTLWSVLDNALRDGVTLSDLADGLRQAANRQAPQGGSGARRQLETTPVEGAVRRLRAPDPARVPPLWLAAMSVWALLSCFAVGWLSAFGGLAGPILGLLWVVLAVMMLWRRPISARTVGHAAALAANEMPVLVTAVPLCALFGVLAGAAQTPVDLPLDIGIGIDVVVLCSVVLVTHLAWKRMVDGWIRRLRVEEVTRLNESVAATVDAAIADQGVLAQWRRRLADAGLLLVSGLEDVRDEFERAATDDDAAAREWTGNTPLPELPAVLRQDLGALSLLALRGYLADIASGADLAVDRHDLSRQVADLLANYLRHVRTHGVHMQPPMIADSEPRKRLSAALWARCDDGRRMLRQSQRAEMVQLCRLSDLRMLNQDWTEVRAVRFAAGDAQSLLLGAEDPEVIPVGIHAVGTIRLVPLRAGLPRLIQPGSEEQPVL